MKAVLLLGAIFLTGCQIPDHRTHCDWSDFRRAEAPPPPLPPLQPVRNRHIHRLHDGAAAYAKTSTVPRTSVQ